MLNFAGWAAQFGRNMQNDNFRQKSQQPARFSPTGMTLERSIAGTQAMDRQNEGSEGSPCAMTLVDTGGMLP